MILGQYETCLSADSVENEDKSALRYPVKFLSKIDAEGALPNQQLKITKMFIVMILNKSTPHSHCNGKSYIVEDLSTYLFLFANCSRDK